MKAYSFIALGPFYMIVLWSETGEESFIHVHGRRTAEVRSDLGLTALFFFICLTLSHLEPEYRAGDWGLRPVHVCSPETLLL